MARSLRWWALSLAPVSVDGLGGVLGQVAGDLAGAEGPVGVVGAAVGADWAGVELTTEGQDPCGVACVDTRDLQPHRSGGGSDQAGQARGVDRGGGGREPLGGAGAVEADQGVEVDHPTRLVLSDLGVLHRRDLGQPVRRDLQVLGEEPVQGDGEPAP